MRLLAQGAQVGHTQPINTWQSNPRDTPRTQHQPPAESRPGVLFYGIPAQVDFLWESRPGGLFMEFQPRWTPYGNPTQVGHIMLMMSRDSLS